MPLVADERAVKRSQQIWARLESAALRLRHGFQRPMWAFADQGVVSLGSFVTTLLVARALTPPEYGRYALMFGVLLLCITLNASLVTSSLSVEGSTADTHMLRQLSTCSLVLALALAAACSPAVVGAALVLADLHLALWVVAALLTWQLQETVRRGLMAHLLYRQALLGDTISYFGQVAVVWFLAQRSQLSPQSAFASMAITSGLAALVQGAQLGLERAPAIGEIYAMASRSWGRGRWLLLGSLTAIPTMQGMPWALALLYGPGGAASLQAAINVMGVSHPVMFAVGNLVLPAAAKRHREGGLAAAVRTSLTFAGAGAALLLPYFVLVWVLPEQVLRVFYGPDSPYGAVAGALPVFVLAYGCTYVSAFLAALLTSLDRSRFVFLAQAASAASALVIGLPLIALLGLMGAAWGSIATSVAFTGTCLLLLRRARSPRAWHNWQGG